MRSLLQVKPLASKAEDYLERIGKLWLAVESFQGRNRNKVGEYLDPNAENPPPTAPPPQKEPRSLEEEFKAKGADPDVDEDDIPMK